MTHVIPLLPRQRLLARAAALAETGGADEKGLALCLRALPMAQPDLKQRLLLFLARTAPEQALDPAWEILSASREPHNLRLCAAVQIKGMLCRDTPGKKDLVKRLTAGLSHPTPEMRKLCLCALSFPGNREAFAPIREAFLDPDISVRLAAVAALAGLGLAEAFEPLCELLRKGNPEEKKAVLFNLWRTGRDREETTSIYARYVFHESPEIRLVCMAFLPERADLFQSLLRDPEKRVRSQALERLCALGPKALAPAEDSLLKMLEDPDMQIKKAALKAIKMLERQ